MITRRNFIKKSFILSAAGSLTFNNTELIANTDDKIKTPLLKVDGKFKEISWKKAYDIMQEKALDALKHSGVNGVGLFADANISVEESYAFNKLFKAGFRSNNISTSSFENEEIALEARTIVYGIDGVSGTLDDILNSDYAILFDINSSRMQINKNTKYINITNSLAKNKSAFLNINIKDSTYSYLLNYIINEQLKTINEDDLIYLKKHFVFANFKDNTQWEISFKNYKKSVLKYTLEYVSDICKLDEKENIKDFQDKILHLKNILVNKNKKIISLTSSIFNKSKDSLQSNILLQSIHLLVDKHSRPGCGVFNISNHISQGSLDDVGLYSNRLPSNMYVKYKEHREKAEKIFNLAKGTLNPVSYTHDEFLNHIDVSVTKFLWVCASDNNSFINTLSNKDLFIVSSSNYINKSNINSNLILPTASSRQKNSIIISEDRKITYLSQEELPQDLSMSLLWQVIEFSKRFTFADVYKRVKVDNTQALKDVLTKFISFGYLKEDSLYNLLFDNPKLRLFDKSYGLNTEMNSDKRFVIGSDGGVFIGYRYNIQEYLFNEYRQFTLSNAHDVLRYEDYVNSKKTILWPVINNKSIKYRFNPIDDIYARESLKDNRKFSFYGKMKEKNLPFGDLKSLTNDEINKKTFKYRAKIFTCNIEE